MSFTGLQIAAKIIMALANRGTLIFVLKYLRNLIQWISFSWISVGPHIYGAQYNNILKAERVKLKILYYGFKFFNDFFITFYESLRVSVKFFFFFSFYILWSAKSTGSSFKGSLVFPRATQDVLASTTINLKHRKL